MLARIDRQKCLIAGHHASSHRPCGLVGFRLSCCGGSSQIYANLLQIALQSARPAFELLISIGFLLFEVSRGGCHHDIDVYGVGSPDVTDQRLIFFCRHAYININHSSEGRYS